MVWLTPENAGFSDRARGSKDIRDIFSHWYEVPMVKFQDVI